MTILLSGFSIDLKPNVDQAGFQKVAKCGPLIIANTINPHCGDFNNAGFIL